MTPVERLARALHDAEVGDYGPCVTERQCIESYEQTLPAALTAALDVDELAEALRRALDDVADRTEDYARALKNHLLGDENHE